MIHIKESLELCNIWQVTNSKKKQFTYLDRYNSNVLQEYIKKTDILTSAATDHSPIFISFSKNPETPRGNGLWKFNNSLRISIDYTTKLKEKLFKTYSENNPKGKYN